MKTVLNEYRRQFLKSTIAGGVAAMMANRLMIPTATAQAVPAPAPTTMPTARVSLTNGDQRSDNIFRALRTLEKEIAQSIGNRRVVIKPNNVSTTNQLAATHSDALVAI